MSIRKEPSPARDKAASSKLYHKAYYLGPRGVPGAREFVETKGRTIHPRLKRLFDLAEVKSNMMILDIGCGRGDVVFQSAMRGAFAVGLDYSFDAIEIAENMLKTPQNITLKKQISFHVADAKKIPFRSNTFDMVGRKFSFLLSYPGSV